MKAALIIVEHDLGVAIDSALAQHRRDLGLRQTRAVDMGAWLVDFFGTEMNGVRDVSFSTSVRRADIDDADRGITDHGFELLGFDNEIRVGVLGRRRDLIAKQYRDAEERA